MKLNVSVLQVIHHPVFRIILWTALGGLLYAQVSRLPHHDLTLEGFTRQLYSKWYWLLIVCALMPFNWWLEAKKWQYLEHKRRPVKLLIKQVLGSTAMGLMTPGRVGELAGRVALATHGYRRTAFWSTVFSHTAQWVVLMGFGLMATPIVLADRQLHNSVWPVYIAVVPLVAGVFIYYNQSAIAERLSEHPVLNKLSWWPRVRMPRYAGQVLSIVLALAACRYGIYSFQYAGLLTFFGSIQPAYQLLPGIAVLFLLQALAPVDTLSGIMVRSQIGLLIWSPLGIAPITVLLATFSLWVINLLLPSLYGVYLLRKKTEFKPHEKSITSTPAHPVCFHSHHVDSGHYTGPDQHEV